MYYGECENGQLASFVRPLEDVHFSIVIGVSRGWLKTSYYHNDDYYNIRIPI